MSLTAAAHVEMLAELGHDVSIIGAFAPVLQERLPVQRRFHVPSSGSGALYAPARVDRDRITTALDESRPNLVVVEAWQTALTDASVEVAAALSLPILMVSHGVSLHPFSAHWRDRVRAFGWNAYRARRLPGLVAQLSAMTTLADRADSSRFYDRDIARQLGVPVVPLGNFPIHWSPSRPPRSQRKAQLILVGYFSSVKNQLGALDVLRRLPPEISLRFVGPKRGPYYAQCAQRTIDFGLSSRVAFSDDSECDLAREIAASMVMLSTSITEALPICLLEAMASGTPFVATPVGAVPELGVGLICSDAAGQAEAILQLTRDATLWQQVSEAGVARYEARFTQSRIRTELADAVSLAHLIGSRQLPRLPRTETLHS